MPPLRGRSVVQCATPGTPWRPAHQATPPACLYPLLPGLADLMVDGAGPGGPFERALLLVLSDHGQTPGGDHGGGSADETDTVLVALAPGKLRRHEAQAGAGGRGGAGAEGAGGGGREAGVGGLAAVAAAGGQAQQLSDEELDRLQGELLSNAWARSGGTRGVSDGAGESAAAGGPAPEAVCSGSMPQIDLTPALALLLGLPIPFGNLGKVPEPLWRVLAEDLDSDASGAGGGNAAPATGSGNGGSVEPGSVRAWGRCGGAYSYSAALATNAAQVHRYLNAYSRAAKLPAWRLARANELYSAAKAAAADAAPSGGGSGDTAEAAETAAAASVQAGWSAFLGDAADLARAQFTQFHQGYIWGGVAAVALAAALHLHLCW